MESLVRSIASVVDDLIGRSIEKRTTVEFRAVRDEVFPKYFIAVRALSDLAKITVPKHDLEVLAAESFSEMEAVFREKGLTAFGAEMRDQAIFTAWTLRKISNICDTIKNAKLAPEHKKTDKDFVRQFAFYLMWTCFHLECLLRSLETQKPIYPEVLDEVIDGLRAAVNAYALARRGLDLRVPQPEPEIPAVEWDEEDRKLLDEATHDVLTEPV